MFYHGIHVCVYRNVGVSGFVEHDFADVAAVFVGQDRLGGSDMEVVGGAGAGHTALYSLVRIPVYSGIFVVSAKRSSGVSPFDVIAGGGRVVARRNCRAMAQTADAVA